MEEKKRTTTRRTQRRQICEIDIPERWARYQHEDVKEKNELRFVVVALKCVDVWRPAGGDEKSPLFVSREHVFVLNVLTVCVYVYMYIYGIFLHHFVFVFTLRYINSG